MKNITLDLDKMTSFQMRKFEKVLIDTISSINEDEDKMVWYQILGTVFYAHELKYMERDLTVKNREIVELYKSM